jgi:hypothetical protein
MALKVNLPSDWLSSFSKVSAANMSRRLSWKKQDTGSLLQNEARKLKKYTNRFYETKTTMCKWLDHSRKQNRGLPIDTEKEIKKLFPLSPLKFFPLFALLNYKKIMIKQKQVVALL